VISTAEYTSTNLRLCEGRHSYV